MGNETFNPRETARLILRRFVESDLPSFLAYRNDPAVARYQGWQLPYSEETGRAFIEEQTSATFGRLHQWIQLALELKETGQLIGDCAVKIKDLEGHQAEIGYTLARAYQGQGLATEALSSLLDYLFTELEMHRVTAITDCENEPSIALLERLGLRREGHFIQNIWFKGRWADEYLYALLRNEWRQRQEEQGSKGTEEKRREKSEAPNRTESDQPSDSPGLPSTPSTTRKARHKKGLVIVNTGNGKGKTTAALGLMTRAWGRNMKIGIIQFIKHENARFGEVIAGERMGFDWIATGDGFTWTSQDMDETEARARHGWRVAQERIASGDYNLLVLDEFTYPLHYGWLDTTAVIDWLRANKPPMLHLVITGRYAPPALIEYADLVTEMVEVKHPFNEQHIRAQAGIEF